MAKPFTLTEAQIERREMYQKVGWPETLTLADIVLYEMKSENSLKQHYFDRDDFPSVSTIDRGFWIPRKDWEAFKSAVARGQHYGGLEGVVYE